MTVLRGLGYLLLLWAVSTGLFALKVWQQGGEAAAGLVPAWLFWMALVPIIWLLTGWLPLRGMVAVVSLFSQALLSVAVLFVFAVYVLLIEGHGPGAAAADRLLGIARQQSYFVLFMYWANAGLGYLFRFVSRPKIKKPARFLYDNSILIKTSFGYVLVEIESFQYVRGGGRKIMFHTGQSTPLNRQRLRITDGELVDENRYRPDRRIVIDLAKIRRAVKRGDQEYVFFIGFSHEVKLNAEMYRKLGGWLPRPVQER